MESIDELIESGLFADEECEGLFSAFAFGEFLFGFGIGGLQSGLTTPFFLEEVANLVLSTARTQSHLHGAQESG